MYKSILIPTDGSELSRHAVTYGLKLAKATGASVTAVLVTAPFHAFSVDPVQLTDSEGIYIERVKALVHNTLDEVASSAKLEGAPCSREHVVSDLPYRAIIDTAKECEADLIVMASHGRRGVSAMLLGSETLKVLTHSTIPVLVVRTLDGA